MRASSLISYFAIILLIPIELTLILIMVNSIGFFTKVNLRIRLVLSLICQEKILKFIPNPTKFTLVQIALIIS